MIDVKDYIYCQKNGHDFDIYGTLLSRNSYEEWVSFVFECNRCKVLHVVYHKAIMRNFNSECVYDIYENANALIKQICSFPKNYELSRWP